MKFIPARFLFYFRLALLLLPGASLPCARAQGPDTVQRTIHSHFWGDRTYTSLVIDGGIVPLVVPPGGDTQVRGGTGVTITWPKDDAIARIVRATRAEAGLLDLMGQKEAADAWKKYIASTLHGTGYKVQVHDFQPDVLDVNHWRIGAITMDYSLGGRASSSLLMLWRCKDGSSLAVTLDASPETFESHSKEIFSMIGTSLVLAP
jgi:hypothetical protein